MPGMITQIPKKNNQIRTAACEGYEDRKFHKRWVKISVVWISYTICSKYLKAKTTSSWTGKAAIKKIKSSSCKMKVITPCTAASL
jgi:hypothetical protein